MFGREKQREAEIHPDQIAGVDRLGRQIVRAAGLSDDECDQAASSPMLYARIHAQIAREQSGTRDLYGSWFGMILAAWRAIPVMAIITIIAAGLFWLVSASNKAERPRGPEVARVQSASAEGLGPVSACSISSKEECGISTEDVLATMIDQGREDSGR
jgi:hypothetical protein